MISKEVQSEGMKKGRRRRRSARSRAAKRRARKMADRAGDISPVKCAVHVFLMKYQSALRKVPTQLPPKVHAGPPTKRVKRVSWREESGGGGGGDPAVLAVGPARRPLKYTRDELMRLRDSPLVRRDLENAFAGCDSLALVLKKRADSPNEEEKGGKQDAPQENHKGPYGRRSADPRERVRKESEPSGGIVLSPQRRSFTSGCGAPATAPQPPPPLARTRPDSPLSAQPQPAPLKTEQAGRRIGSGRIMVRDVPAGNWEEAEYRAEPYRRGNERYDRRSFGRDSYTSDIKREREDRFNNEKLRDREDNNRRGGRFSQRRFEKEDEPEWFSGGPTSQLETIELRGFDEPVKKNGKDDRQNEKWNNNNGSRSPPERWRAEPEPAPTDTHLNVSDNKDSGMESKDEEGSQNNEQADFNLDEFLKPDAFPDVLTNGSSEAEGGSRFSRWFRRDSPPAPAGPPTGPPAPAPASDARHYERLLHDMLDDLDSSNIEPPMPEPTPMYPPPGHHGGPPHHPGHHQPQMRGTAAPTLLDLLRRARSDTDQRTEMNNGVGKIHSLEELEARLRPQQPPPAPAPTEHDLTAFKRLLAQVSGGHVVAAEPRPQQPPPMSLLQMLNKSMEQQQQQQQAKAPPQQPHIPQELLYKLLQVQQRQQQGPPPSEMPGPGGPPSGPAGPTQADRELLQRPEAQAIIHGLKAGEITVQHLMQQLGNPGLQNRHRELLLTIVRLHHHHQQQQQYQRQQQMGGSPLPGAPHLVVPPHHQPLRLSPLPHPGVPARIPSPRELAAHTQSIMQGALIKKKLEEQRENYRRRHEPQPHHKPTPISFTPTSVLRKMTADKESDAPSPKQQQQWSQPPKMPQGRPIVKGNQSGILQMGYPQSQGDYQQHYLNQQQQQMSGNRAFALPQQRPPVNNSYNTMGSMGNMRGVAGSSALHQLLVHSHQRSLNEMAGGGGGDNQLARWFSPELLAQASAGKLPSVSHVPNALSLEDLERHHHSPAPPVRN
ncbi:eukaryotic translation initiation factor 4E transporter-like isoform X2 [Aricia agestis]|uniref:eukaryotic translation initiation factor 4E transporter-like isoform X2 n=1 Tax=Aricia agestis TaxID=91739 RepID=UPI001C202F35|nr:eukaryotic translation initiation factor 4E transporter-like isoform X2 [Aricia agestis]